MSMPVIVSDVRVESAPDPERAEALAHYIRSAAADSTAVMARLLYAALSVFPDCTCPLFCLGGPSLFKSAVSLARTEADWECLEEVTDDAVRLALSMANYALGRSSAPGAPEPAPRRTPAVSLRFEAPPASSTPRPRSSPEPRALAATG